MGFILEVVLERDIADHAAEVLLEEVAAPLVLLGRVIGPTVDDFQDAVGCGGVGEVGVEVCGEGATRCGEGDSEQGDGQSGAHGRGLGRSHHKHGLKAAARSGEACKMQED